MARKIFSIKRILFGWYLVLKRPKRKDRLLICKTCEFRKWIVCGKCGCPLIALSQLDDGCEVGKW